MFKWKHTKRHCIFIGDVCAVLSKVCLIFSEPSDDLNDLNFFNQKKKKKKPKKVFDNDVEESFKVS